ncbi:MAG TPA: ABC transporter permease, partial [Puia sp.]|nr:ABC transporter permease [Puia sp.]
MILNASNSWHPLWPRIAMFRNYFKIAWRNLRKNKVFSFINIAGLSLGISVCFIITLYVRDELCYERYNVYADRIARIQFRAVMGGSQISEAGVMAPVAKTLRSDYPEVENATRLLPLGKSKVVCERREFRNDLLALVDSNFFDIFTLPLSRGDARTALAQPHSVVISQAMAEKYFGKQDPVGRTLAIDDDQTLYKVTGVFAGMPSHSDFRFDMLGSLAGFQPAQSDSWLDGSYRTYLLLKPRTDLAALQAKFPEMVKKYMGPQIQRVMHMSLDQFMSKGNQLGFVLQPLTAIHLHPIATTNDASATDGFAPPGDASYVYIFGAIAGFMLLIACINFVNLSTAGASKRAREVGVRKAIGSDRSQLIAQFLTESAVVVFIALALSSAIIYFSLPVFNAISGKALSFTLSPGIFAMLALFGLIVIVAAGMYPAFFMSAFKPARVLKGKLTANHSSFRLRSGLVVFQFVISVSLIIGTIVVYGQMRYIQNKELGYVKEQVITIPNSAALMKNEALFRDIMLKDPRVISATMSQYKPAGASNSNNS